MTATWGLSLQESQAAQAQDHLTTSHIFNPTKPVITSAPGSKERATLVNMLNDGQHRVKNEWDDTCSYPVTSPLVLSCRDGTKQITVQGIVDWYGAINVTIAAGDVHFFDDRESNIAPFEDTAFNAHQISCATRDPSPGDKYNHPGTEGAVDVVDVVDP